ncbi:hypothetical protein OR221_0318 [Microbacterium laevaniformans OR221]|nr:hypothetical protein OR221_0318 [Microbacterium laevaniformans OR221]
MDPIIIAALTAWFALSAIAGITTIRIGSRWLR